MIPIPRFDESINYLVGSRDTLFSSPVFQPYDDVTISFLDALSRELLHERDTREFPDVVAFAFWCRKGNIARLKAEFGEANRRLGVGTVFHIAPSNVPINFAFSFAFSLLAGNRNVVRVPSKDFPQIDVVCSAIRRVVSRQEYRQIADGTNFVRYERSDAVTGSFSAKCDARVIWGGDATVKEIRRYEMPVRGIEIVFADRYSFCVLDGKKILEADQEEIEKLADGFYNDTYLMDQNACSSPHLIVWLGDESVISGAKGRFWKSVHEVVTRKYELHPVNAIDKYMILCENAINHNGLSGLAMDDNYLYRLELDGLPSDVDKIRGKFGCFYEFTTNELDNIAHIVNNKYQTLTYFGVEREELFRFVVGNRLSGIDRVVPVGKGLEIGVVWDGYDIVRTLSRIVYFE